MKRKILVVLGLVLALILMACQAGPAQAKGEAVFTVSDAAADMGTVSNLSLTIDGLRVRSEAGAWTTVNVAEQTFKLLELRDRKAVEILASAELAAGTYDRLELDVTKAVVFDASGEHEAKIPGNKLQLEGMIEVQTGATATANFDFLADKSLHVTGNGQYIFAPVVLLETRTGAEVEIQANKEVKVKGGSVSTSVEIGMDVNGNVGTGLRIAPDAVLSVTASGKLIQVSGHALIKGIIKAVDASSGAVTIVTDAGTEVSLKVNEQSNVKLGGLLSGILGLQSQIGSRIQADYDISTGIVTEMEAQGNAQANAQANAEATATATGKLEGVNTLSGTITVATQAGAPLVLNVDNNTQVLVNGTASSVADLATSIGSQVTVTYNTETKVARKIVVQSSAHSSVSINGTMEAVNPVAGTITVTTQGGTELVLSITSSTRVTVNGAVSGVAVLVTRVGSQVAVTYDTETSVATSIEAQASAGAQGSVGAAGSVTGALNSALPGNVAAQSDASGSASVTGTLASVDTATGTVTIVSASGEVTTLQTTPQTKATVEGNTATTADLTSNVGSSVTAEFNAQTNTATSISVK